MEEDAEEGADVLVEDAEEGADALVEDAEEEADVLVEDAEEEADVLVEDAEEEADGVEEDAEVDGFEESEKFIFVVDKYRYGVHSTIFLRQSETSLSGHATNFPN